MSKVSAITAEPSRFQSASAQNYLWLPIVGIVACLACMPFLRNIFSIGDEGVLLHGAERMLAGRNIYTDFFEFLPPGGFVLTEVWFSMAGVSFGSERLLAMLVIVGIGCFTFLACRQATKDAALSALYTCAWLLMSQTALHTQLSHHWYTTLFSMVTAWVSVKNVMSERPGVGLSLLSGFAAGAAIMVTPTCGLLAAAAGLIPLADFRTHPRPLMAYVVGGAVMPFGMVGYLAMHGSLIAGINDFVFFTAARYAGIQGVPFGFGTTSSDRPLELLFPLLALLTVLVVIRDARGWIKDPVPRIGIAFALAGFIGIFPRSDSAHIAYAVPLALPLFAYVLAKLTRSFGARARAVLSAGVVVACLPAALEYAFHVKRDLDREVLSTPRGDVTFRGDVGMKNLLPKMAATPPRDKYFFYPYMPLIPFLSGRGHVANYDIFQPGYTTPAQYRDACLSVLREASWVVIDRWWLDPKMVKFAFPAIKDVEPPETKGFQRVLEGAFDLVWVEGTFELRHRRSDAGVELCEGVPLD